MPQILKIFIEKVLISYYAKIKSFYIYKKWMYTLLNN